MKMICTCDGNVTGNDNKSEHLLQLKKAIVVIVVILMLKKIQHVNCK
jgi:hypothetical protein